VKQSMIDRRSLIDEDEDEMDDSIKCERELAGTRTGSRMGPDSTYCIPDTVTRWPRLTTLRQRGLIIC
jgi:hypothetical protein